MCQRTEQFESLTIEGNAEKLSWYARKLLNQIFKLESENERLKILNQILLEEHEC